MFRVPYAEPAFPVAPQVEDKIKTFFNMGDHPKYQTHMHSYMALRKAVGLIGMIHYLSAALLFGV